MNKGMVYLAISIGGAVGGYIPVLFGAGGFSAWSILGSAIGSILAIYFCYKVLTD